MIIIMIMTMLSGTIIIIKDDVGDRDDDDHDG